jgi:SAM-dependent methyltransferase
MGPAQVEVHAEMEERHWWFAGRRMILRALAAQILADAEHATIVDVGCGTGGNAGALAERYRVIGIDPSPLAVAHARARHPGVRFEVGSDPELLGDDAHGADLFLLMDVLEHVEDAGNLLERVVACAKPGAHVLVTVPAGMELWSEHDTALGHLRRYEPETLRPLWAALPVEVRLLSPFNARLYAPIRAARVLGRWRRRAWGGAGTDLARAPGPLNHLLTLVFGAESGALIDALSNHCTPAFRRGVSLVAVLRKETDAPWSSEVREHAFPRAVAGNAS